MKPPMDPGGCSPWAVTSIYVGPNRRKCIRRKGEDQKKVTKKKTKLRGRSPQANYTDRATAACRRSFLVPNFAGRGCCVVSATNSHGH
jgi:hypothetical protein